MPRGELIAKLLANYKRSDDFHATAMELIAEEEKKSNFVLAKALRRALENGDSTRSGRSSTGKNGQGSLHLLPQEKDKGAALLEQIDPVRRNSEIILSPPNLQLLMGVVQEYRRGDAIRSHGLRPRSKLLFCGPPGCGKTLCAEIFANEVGLPLLVARFDVLVSSFLGETSSNLRKVFDFVADRPSVLFLDEFDAVGRSRSDDTEHSELRRVVSSLLQLVDHFRGNGFIIAATNHEHSLDPAIWRRFDEVIVFERPIEREILRLLKLKLGNFPVDFDPSQFAQRFRGFSHAEIERVCINAIKSAIIQGYQSVSIGQFASALDVELERRRAIDRIGHVNESTPP